jgi:hypothetical protein
MRRWWDWQIFTTINARIWLAQPLQGKCLMILEKWFIFLLYKEKAKGWIPELQYYRRGWLRHDEDGWNWLLDANCDGMMGQDDDGARWRMFPPFLPPPLPPPPSALQGQWPGPTMDSIGMPAASQHSRGRLQGEGGWDHSSTKSRETLFLTTIIFLTNNTLFMLENLSLLKNI